MNRYLLSIIAVIMLAIFGFLTLKPNPKTQIKNEEEVKKDEVHYHAGFRVYKNNILEDYSGLEYMAVEPCTENEKGEDSESPEHEQIEKAHLHDGIGDVVHVERAGSVWRDLFTNMKVEITTDAISYLNGVETENFLDLPIKTYDSLVIFEGENTDMVEKLKAAVTKDHIIETEQRSENCGS